MFDLHLLELSHLCWLNSLVSKYPSTQSIDCCVTMSAHMTATVRACFAALRMIRSVRRSLPRHALLTLVRPLVISKVDYCNSVLAGLPVALLHRLQLVLNAAAQIKALSRTFSHRFKDFQRPCLFSMTFQAFKIWKNYSKTFKDPQGPWNKNFSLGGSGPPIKRSNSPLHGDGLRALWASSNEVLLYRPSPHRLGEKMGLKLKKFPAMELELETKKP